MKLKQTKYLMLIIGITISINILGVNKDNLFFRDIKLKDGLPSNTITSITQDSLGFMWIATNDGICKYDGLNFRIFRYEPNSNNSIYDNDIRKNFIDSRGDLWIVSSAGVDNINLKSNTITKYTKGKGYENTNDASPIDITGTSDSTIILGFYDSGVGIKTANSNSFNIINDKSPAPLKLSSNKTRALSLYNDSLLFVGYKDKGVDIHNLKKGTTRSLEDIAKAELPSTDVSALYFDNKQGIWIATSKGIAYYNIKTEALSSIYIDRSIASAISETRTLFVDCNNRLWIGTQNDGVIIIDEIELHTRGIYAPYKVYKPNHNDGSLSYRTVVSIFQDANRNIWIGTEGGGLDYVEDRSERFGIIRYNPADDQSISYDKVWGITEDRNGSIWIGTDGYGVNVWDQNNRVTKRYVNIEGDETSLSDNAILSAATDYNGNIWLGTYAGGLNRYDEINDIFIRYSKEQGLIKDDVRAIYVTSDNTVWVGLNGGGLAKYNRSSDRFESIEGLEHYDVRSIIKEGNNIWLGTFYNGLVRYSLHDNSITKLNSNRSNNIKTIFSIELTNDGYLWLATKRNGLVRFEISTEKIKMFTKEHGLYNNRINSVLSDSRGNLWLTSNNCISKFNISKKTFTNYDWRDGVQGGEFHNGSGLVTRNNMFCFGGLNGLNYFNPEKFTKIVDPQNLKFTNLMVNNLIIEPDNSSIIDKNIEYNPIIKLNHNHNVFTIAFQSIDYPFANSSNYKYILEGYDKDWNHVGNINRATYRNVPAGDYIFKVASDDNRFSQEQTVSSIEISVSPSFWKTKLAFTIYFTIVVLILIVIFRFRIIQYKTNSRLRYERKLRDSEKRLHNERLEFFTNISHELRTPITIIGIALDDIAENEKDNNRIKRYVDTAISNSNRLIELINKILEFRQVETGVSSLIVDSVEINRVVDLCTNNFIEMAEHNDIELKVQLPSISPSVWIDKDKFDMIMNNLLSNAFKHTPAEGSIKVTVEDYSNHILIKVSDSGKGIPEDIQKKIFDRYFKMDTKSTSTGIGLALTKSLVSLHKGEITVESKKNNGATFIVKILKGKDHLPINKRTLEDETKQIENIPTEEQLHQDRDQKIILIVDDNEEIVTILESKFNSSFKVYKAYNGKDGVRIAKHISPDIIISDIMMPIMSGTELCRQLKSDKTTSHIPIILLTAKVSEKDEISGLDIGADDYISKPFKISILKARVNTIIENRRKFYNYIIPNSGLLNSNESIITADLKVGDIDIKTEDEVQSKLESSDNIDEAQSNLELNDIEVIFINTLNDYILNNCLTDDISVFEIASKLGFSRSTLYRKVKTLTGMSINAYVRTIKIERSAELLREGKNVSEAAYLTGFNDIKYFRESFKKIMGKNPSDLKI